jgi:hypothetical protein
MNVGLIAIPTLGEYEDLDVPCVDDVRQKEEEEEEEEEEEKEKMGEELRGTRKRRRPHAYDTHGKNATVQKYKKETAEMKEETKGTEGKKKKEEKEEKGGSGRERGREKEEEEEEEEVLSCGFIIKAPLPVERAIQFESSNSIEEGAYFMSLMRKRFQCIHDVQIRWLSRACNHKHPKYMETQARLKDFAEIVVLMFDAQFGTNPNTPCVIPTRKHMHRKKSDKKMQQGK